jgi:hypothetical protein
MSADLSQAEIYILLCPRAEAEQEIVRMVEKALGGYSLPPLAPSRAPGIPGTTSGDDWLTLASLAAIADRVRREGLLVPSRWPAPCSPSVTGRTRGTSPAAISGRWRKPARRKAGRPAWSPASTGA